MNDAKIWEAMKDVAGRQLPGGFSRGVVARFVALRQKRRQARIAICTLAICLFCTGGISAWRNHRQTQQNLAHWREYAEITRAMEQTL